MGWLLCSACRTRRQWSRSSKQSRSRFQATCYPYGRCCCCCQKAEPFDGSGPWDRGRLWDMGGNWKRSMPDGSAPKLSTSSCRWYRSAATPIGCVSERGRVEPPTVPTPPNRRTRGAPRCLSYRRKRRALEGKSELAAACACLSVPAFLSIDLAGTYTCTLRLFGRLASKGRYLSPAARRRATDSITPSPSCLPAPPSPLLGGDPDPCRWETKKNGAARYHEVPDDRAMSCLGRNLDSPMSVTLPDRHSNSP
ncbi:hypothetical protein B0T22DRAFT_86405 [Podospora appendiculata]|uniref:Uncharacterized protein n=1 Tax=Podospora appendiculata TaxID=314037 RepID=A0AAE1CI30_9PEZI|nr:hypothetical protein B0T22DRAFT_86405 [Podospora appendiculata]